MRITRSCSIPKSWRPTLRERRRNRDHRDLPARDGDVRASRGSAPGAAGLCSDGSTAAVDGTGVAAGIRAAGTGLADLRDGICETVENLRTATSYIGRREGGGPGAGQRKP